MSTGCGNAPKAGPATPTAQALLAEVRRDGIELVDPPPMRRLLDAMNARGQGAADTARDV